MPSRIVPYFAVIRERGPAWDVSRELEQQERWDEHAAFMDGLADEAFIVVGGPLGDATETLLIVEADGEEAIRRRFEPDPWTGMELLRVKRVEPWHIRLGGLTPTG
jgi:uncharacterized protein YciI